MLEMILGGAGAVGNLLSNIFGDVNSNERYKRIVDPFTQGMVDQSQYGLNLARANRRAEIAGVTRRSNTIAADAASKTFGASAQMGLGPGNAGAVQAFTQAMMRDQSEAQGINAANQSLYNAEMQHANTLGRASDQTMYRFQQENKPNFALRAGQFLQEGASAFGDGYAGGKLMRDLFAYQPDASAIPSAQQRIGARRPMNSYTYLP